MWVQLAAVLHGAEHGFEEHEHENKPCEFVLFHKHSDTALAADIILSTPVSYHLVNEQSVAECSTFIFNNKAHPSRAPPVYA